jgi:DNA polymerase-3 subunit beta
MRFSITTEALLKPLQAVHGVVERRQTLPILSNVLLSARDGVLSLTGTDMEVELIARTTVEDLEDGEITVPARKFVDICRALPADGEVKFEIDGERAVVRCGRSRFNLATIAATDFPSTEEPSEASRLKLPSSQLKRLIELTQFAMAQQDVRYYLNGMLFEIEDSKLRTVATDGHRLALAECDLDSPVDGGPRQLILPRKGVVELAKMLTGGDEEIELVLGNNAVRLDTASMSFSSKLIDGRFPEYQRVIPVRDDTDKEIIADRESLKRSLQRAAILSNEKYRAVRLCLESGLLRIMASNPEQEQAEDEVEVDYEGEALEIGFNVSYLIDALSTVPGESAKIYLTDASSSCLVVPVDGESCQYVVMPMRL